MPLYLDFLRILDLTPLLEILKDWWWLLPPIVLFLPFKELFLYWRRMSADKKLKFIVLEIKIPREILKSLRGMEHCFSALWGIYDSPNLKDKWLKGKTLISFALELVSINGEIHFFIRVPDSLQDIVESSIYSQFSNVEISVVDDYTKRIAQDIPNKDWDLWGSDFCLSNDDIYPIKTFSKFFEEKLETPKEEKRVDPLAPLLEGMVKLRQGEQFWLQFIITPISKKENDYVDRGKALINKLVKRPVAPKQKTIIQGAAEILIMGTVPGQAGESKNGSEMKLTPGEKDIVQEVERKISKYAFDTNIRCVYLGKKDVFSKSRLNILFSFLASLSAPHLNSFKPWKKTIVKENLIFKKRRFYLKKRAMLKNYIQRVPSPGSSAVLNTEELATLYHFPHQFAVPTPFVSRLESKKSEPPVGLPTE